MNTWKVEITLKSGKTLTVLYEGPETNSGKVAEVVMEGGSNHMNGFYDLTKKHNILVLVGEIAALDISEWRKSK